MGPKKATATVPTRKSPRKKGKKRKGEEEPEEQPSQQVTATAAGYTDVIVGPDVIVRPEPSSSDTESEALSEVSVPATKGTKGTKGLKGTKGTKGTKGLKGTKVTKEPRGRGSGGAGGSGGDRDEGGDSDDEEIRELKLILDFYEEHPHHYDLGQRNYKDEKLKERELEELATALGPTWSGE